MVCIAFMVEQSVWFVLPLWWSSVYGLYCLHGGTVCMVCIAFMVEQCVWFVLPLWWNSLYGLLTFHL
jgi:hypothetical protein